MNKISKNNVCWSAVVSSTITTLFIFVLTVAGELYKVADSSGKMVNPIKDYLKALHGHHWVGKGIWAVATFFVVWGFLVLIQSFSNSDRNLARAINVLAVSLMFFTVLFFGFFTYEYFLAH